MGFGARLFRFKSWLCYFLTMQTGMLLTSLCFGVIICKMRIIVPTPHRIDVTELAYSDVVIIIIILLQYATTIFSLKAVISMVKTLFFNSQQRFFINENHLYYLFHTLYFCHVKLKKERKLCIMIVGIILGTYLLHIRKVCQANNLSQWFTKLRIFFSVKITYRSSEYHFRCKMPELMAVVLAKTQISKNDLVRELLM